MLTEVDIIGEKYVIIVALAIPHSHEDRQKITSISPILWKQIGRAWSTLRISQQVWAACHQVTPKANTCSTVT